MLVLQILALGSIKLIRILIKVAIYVDATDLTTSSAAKWEFDAFGARSSTT